MIFDVLKNTKNYNLSHPSPVALWDKSGGRCGIRFVGGVGRFPQARFSQKNKKKYTFFSCLLEIRL